MGLDRHEPTIFELDHGGEGRDWFSSSPTENKPVNNWLPDNQINQEEIGLPSLSEGEVVRHYTKLSRLNFCIDSGFYPLGSCTMKYNPKVNDVLSGLPGFANLHPAAPDDCAQGTMKLIHEISGMISQLMGMDAVTMNPCAGAHGELCGILMIRAYHRDHNQNRHVVLVPDSAHGTNPATAAMAGFDTKEVKSNEHGCVDLDDLRAKLDENTAALMLTNPNTLGLFEKDILEIAKMVHEAGALLYYDGANLNAIAGVCRPGDMGFDVCHINLHKTFSTPHGGGGPGSGPVGVKEKLIPYLPIPVLEEKEGGYQWDFEAPKTIGQLSSYYGNVGIVLRAYIYMRIHGLVGIQRNSEHAVLNARYLLHHLKELIPVEIDDECMHEFVLTLKDKKRFNGLNPSIIAKNLIDRGFHAPTVYFPLIVKDCLMIEPTESESRQTLDVFLEVMKEIVEAYNADPEKTANAPYTLPVKKLDEVGAARKPELCFCE